MEQFTVPQFIEREAKILGPVTVRQFILCLVAVGLGFLAYKFSDFELFIVEAIIIVAVFGAFAFVPINGRPFHYFIIGFIQSQKRPHVRVWKKEAKIYQLKAKSESQKTQEQKEEAQTKLKQEQIKQGLAQKKLAKSRLSKLSLTVDTGGRFRENQK